MNAKLPDNLDSLGERIRFLRGARSAGEYAGKLGVHANTLLNYERGERPPNSNFLVRLCQLEEVDAGWLLLGISEEEKATLEVRYQRSLLEHIGSTAHELAPPGLGPRFGKLLAMAYEQSVLHEVDRACVGTIIKDLVGLLEPNTTRGDGDAGNTHQSCCTTC